MSNVPQWLARHSRPGAISPVTKKQLGPLGDVVDEPRVSDVFLTGSGVVFVDTGEGALPVTGLSVSRAEATEVARGLIELGGRHVDEASPVVDAHLGVCGRSGLSLSAHVPVRSIPRAFKHW